MGRLVYSSWGGAIQREILTDPDRPYEFATRTSVNLPDLEANNLALAEGQSALAPMTVLARAPMTVYEQSIREGWDEDDWTRWLNDPDNAPFRVWKGRV
jgi:hypothetical protein